MITETLSPYRYPDKPAVVMPEEHLLKRCRDCGQEYTTASRVQRRCRDCQGPRKRALAVKASRKARAKRAGRSV